LALVDRDMPVVAIAPADALFEKLKSNLQEVRARGGELHVFADADTRMGASEGVQGIRMPDHAGLLSPLLHSVPLQLRAYPPGLPRGPGGGQGRGKAGNLGKVGPGGVPVGGAARGRRRLFAVSPGETFAVFAVTCLQPIRGAARPPSTTLSISTSHDRMVRGR